MKSKQSGVPRFVWWILWGFQLTGIILIFQFIGLSPARVEGETSSPLLLTIPVLPFFFSVGIRWWILPRVRDAMRCFFLFVVGMAMAESTCFMGLFLFPSQKMGLFILSVLGIFQFIPLFSGGRWDRPAGGRTADGSPSGRVF